MEILIICSISFSKENGLISVFKSLTSALDSNTSITVFNLIDGRISKEKSNDFSNINVFSSSYFDLLKYRLPHYMFNSKKIDDEKFLELTVKYDKIYFIGAQSTFNFLKNRKTIKGCFSYVQTDSHLNYYDKKFSNGNFIKKLFHSFLQFVIINFEHRLYKHFNEVLFVSEEDVKIQYLNHSNKNNFKILKLKVDKTNYKHKPKDLDSKLKIVFFGDFNYKPNYEAANFIIKLSSKLEMKNFSFYLIGDGLNITNLPKNIFYLGYLEELDRTLIDMDIFISPIFTGAGLKNKVLKALSVGLPSIVSSESLTGLKIDSINKPFIISNSQEEFMESLFLLNSDLKLRKFYSNNAIKFINKY